MNKSFKFSILACAVMACSVAFATGTQSLPAETTSNSSSESSSASNSVSVNTNGSTALVNSSTGDSNATVGNVESTGVGAGYGGAGGAGGAGGSASASSGDSYSASKSGDVTSRTSSNYLNFPQPVWTTVPTPYGCIVSTSKSGAFGWNFASGSSSRQFSDAVCTTVRMAEAATMHCQFATAALLNKAAFKQMFPKEDAEFFTVGNPPNLDPVACDALRRPVLRMAPMIYNPPAPEVRSSATVFVNEACTVKPKVNPGLGLKKPAARPSCK